jgi:4-diphosphocytidyl-2C-methyl-D-erythritol kinase
MSFSEYLAHLIEGFVEKMKKY